ncbi:MAG: hypothetical protein FJW26_01245 [Acidimicrobiia bacterium]|nr:hypothetical protein [Acidimicrobiia bacterium]
MRFITFPLAFLLGAMIVVGFLHGDLWIAFTQFGTLGNAEKLGCLIAVVAGFFAALLRDN